MSSVRLSSVSDVGELHVRRWEVMVGRRLKRMSQIYESMTVALREHWKANNNAYPQRFELMQAAFEQLIADRTLVNTTMNFLENMQEGWHEEFLGVPLVVASSNVMVAANGDRVPLSD